MLRGVLDGRFALDQPFFHGSRHAGLRELQASKGGEFGPGLYLTSFEPTARFYATHVAKGPDAPTIYRVRVQLPRGAAVIKKLDWLKLTQRRTPKTVSAKYAKDHDGLVGIALNDYEWQLVVFDPRHVTIEEEHAA